MFPFQQYERVLENDSGGHPLQGTLNNTASQTDTVAGMAQVNQLAQGGRNLQLPQITQVGQVVQMPQVGHVVQMLPVSQVGSVVPLSQLAQVGSQVEMPPLTQAQVSQISDTAVDVSDPSR